MYKTILQGRFSHIVRSLANSTVISIQTIVKRALGKPSVRGWTTMFEIGTLYWRAQWNYALAMQDIDESRAYLDSVYSLLDYPLDIEIRHSGDGEPKGDWFIPRQHNSDAMMLYFHGGGYAFYLDATQHFIGLLAQTLGMRIFALDYRLTPEHPHPAQIEDALNAYQFLINQNIDPQHLVVAGDSAGGHLMLMLLARLRDAHLPQPSLGIGLSPWTDTGLRGASQFGNDAYDMVAGYMTLKFSEWLKGEHGFTDFELSPIYQDYRGLAPIYLQAGGKEILVDMIRDFAHTLQSQGCSVRLDVWPLMTHEFHAYGRHLTESREALDCIQKVIKWAMDVSGQTDFSVTVQTEMDGLFIPAPLL